MKAYKFNGVTWYIDDRPLWSRIRRWVACVGLRELKNGGLSWEGEITPLSLFGHRITFFGHWFQAQTPWGWLIVKFARTETGRMTRHLEEVFISHNGTPGCAHTWLVGTPPAIVKHCETRASA